jgi:hypothetical protein
MTAGGWPYIPEQCPDCVYLHPMAPFIDDSGYEILGSCRHQRIAMELFAPQQRRTAGGERCPFLVAQAGTSPRQTAEPRSPQASASLPRGGGGP